jgi:hypothetical protein
MPQQILETISSEKTNKEIMQLQHSSSRCMLVLFNGNFYPTRYLQVKKPESELAGLRLAEPQKTAYVSSVSYILEPYKEHLLRAKHLISATRSGLETMSHTLDSKPCHTL